MGKFMSFVPSIFHSLIFKRQFLNKGKSPQPKQGFILKELSSFLLILNWWLWKMSELMTMENVSFLNFPRVYPYIEMRWYSSARFWRVIFWFCSNFVCNLDLISASFCAVRSCIKIKHLNIFGVTSLNLNFSHISVDYNCKSDVILIFFLCNIQALPSCIEKWTPLPKYFC